MRRKDKHRNDLFLIAFGEVVRNRRLGLFLSQAALADDAGVHRTYITDIEAGHRNLSTFMLLRVAKALRLPLSELIHATEESDLVHD